MRLPARRPRIAALAVAAALSGACGQTGELYLPDDAPPSPTPILTPTDTPPAAPAEKQDDDEETPAG